MQGRGKKARFSPQAGRRGSGSCLTCDRNGPQHILIAQVQRPISGPVLALLGSWLLLSLLPTNPLRSRCDRNEEPVTAELQGGRGVLGAAAQSDPPGHFPANYRRATPTRLRSAAPLPRLGPAAGVTCPPYRREPFPGLVLLVVSWLHRHPPRASKTRG